MVGRSLRSLVHNLFVHPVCGILWLLEGLGASWAGRLADRLHDASAGQDSPLELRVHARRSDELGENVVAFPRPGSITIRDDRGRELKHAAMAFGPVGPELGALFPLAGERPADDSVIVSNQPIDQGKTYVLVLVEHPDWVEVA